MKLKNKPEMKRRAAVLLLLRILAVKRRGESKKNLILLVVFLILPAALAFPSANLREKTTPTAPLNADTVCERFSTGKSELCGSIKVVGGKFVIDNLRFFPNETLRNNYLPSISNPVALAELEKFLADKIQKELDIKGKPLCDYFQPKDKSSCNQNLPVPGLNGNFSKPPLFASKLLSIFSDINSDSPLSLTVKDGVIPVEWSTATIVFEVEDPVDDVCNTEKYKIEILNAGDKAVFSSDKICPKLKFLNGHFWDNARVKAVVTDLYAKRGLIATVESSNNDEGKTLSIRESHVLSRVLLSFKKNAQEKKDKNEVLKIFYNLFSYKDWKKFGYKKIETDRFAQRSYKLEETYLNLFDFQLQQLRLLDIGYDLSVSECDPNNVGIEFVCLEVTKTEKDEKKKSDQEKALAKANSEGVIDPSIIKPGEQNKSIPQIDIKKRKPADKPENETDKPENKLENDDAPADDVVKPAKELTGYVYIGGGVNYQFGDKPRFFARIQRHFFSGNDLSLQVGGEKEVFGNFNYFKNYLFFNQLKRRLSLQLTAQSDFNASRRFDTLTTDERRSGALVRAEYDLLNNRNRNYLRLFTEAQRTVVQLSRDDRVISKTRLRLLDFGFSYNLQPNPIKDYPQFIRIDWRSRFGLGGSGSPQFTALSLSGKYHQLLPNLFEFDFTGRLGSATKKTPVFEQFSLGGDESLRGFKPDDLIGRKFWSVQPELWFPIFGIKSSSKNQLAKFVRENLRIAAFFDVGGIYQTGNNFSGVKSGAGLGLRFIKNPMVIKLDWAKGFGSLPTPRAGRGVFYFGVEYNLPF